MNVNSTLFETGLQQILFQSHWNICFEAIQKGGKLNWVLQVLTEVCHQIFGGFEVQPMWNLL